jgi:GntP family gluconate:H+ symporter
MTSTTLALVGAAGVALLLVLVLKAKLHPFLSLALVSIAVALTARIPVAEVVPTLLTGMGETLGTVATIVTLGAMLGRIIEVSGGADVLASWMLDKFGERRAPWALGATGFLFGIPVFFDVGLIVLIPIVLSVARRLGGNMLLYALPIGGAMLTVHVFLPPHPGAVAGTAAFGADIGLVILFGFIAAVPSVLVSQWLTPRIARRAFVAVPQLAGVAVPAGAASVPAHGAGGAAGGSTGSSTGGDDRATAAAGTDRSASPVEPAPRFGVVLSLILLPLLMIMGQTMSATFLGEESRVRSVLSLVGASPFALLVAVLTASYLLGFRRGWTRTRVEEVVNSSLPPVAAIILITGAGGMFGKTLATTGVGDALADLLGATGLPVILLSFLLSALLRAAQGSATVAIITASGVMAPLVEPLGYAPVQVALVVVAICAGALTLSHVNDSGFWMFSRYFGLETGVALRTWTVLTTVLGTVGFLVTSLVWIAMGAVA